MEFKLQLLSIQIYTLMFNYSPSNEQMLNSTQNFIQTYEHKEKSIDSSRKIIFLRHAQSLSNKAVHDFREERNLPDCWKTFRSIDDFNHKVIYNPELCDCGISAKGEAQCKQAEQKLNKEQIDLILVSPLERALQTCTKVFSQRLNSVKVVVLPMLAQSMKYSSDISKSVAQKKKRYPNFDFSAVQSLGDFWFIKNIDPEHQELYFSHLQSYPHLSYAEKQKEIARFMCLKHLRQTNINMRKRVKQIKILLSNFSKQYKNIAVVSHFYTIKHILAKNVTLNGEVLDEFYGQNCSIHSIKLNEFQENHH